MKYLFIGGSLDGQHIEVADNKVEYCKYDKDLFLDEYTKRAIALEEDNITFISIFVASDINNTAFVWRMIQNYRPKQVTEEQTKQFEYNYKVVSGGKKLNQEALAYAIKELLG